MASDNIATPPHGATSMEVPLKSSTPPPPEYNNSGGRSFKKHALLDVFLRGLLFANALASIIVMVTSAQTKQIPVPQVPGLVVTREAKFSHSTTYIYLIAVLAVAGLYSIITGFVSLLALKKPGGSSAKQNFHFVVLDSLLLGIVASATGAAFGVAYIGLKGNSHSRWNKICNIYDSYCFQIGASLLLSLMSSVILLLLVWVSVYVLSKKIARR